MARLVLVIAILLFQSGFGLQAQNLILNPSFEEKETCYRTSFGDDWYIPKDWTDPDHSSSDFFHPCAPNYLWGSVPENFYGYQYPRTGLSYAGFAFSMPDDKKLKIAAEYVQGKLKKSLVNGHKYRMKFYYSLAEDGCGYTNCVTNNLGVTFTDTFTNTPYFFNDTFLPKPNLLYKEKINKDYKHWHPLEFTFTATQASNYFIVGFMDTSTMELERIDTCWPKVLETYLYVDDFSLVDLTEPEPDKPQIANVFTPNKDGLNDTYITYWEVDPPQKFKMRIYNRWGAKLFETLDPLKGWDGTYNGKEVPAGTYVARIEYTTTDGDKTINQPLYLIR